MSTANPLVKFGISSVLAIILVGCSSMPPTETLSKADFAIQDASRNGAAQFEPQLLNSASTKLNRANRAAEEDENEAAARLAQEAIAEAMLANAKADAARQQQEVEELQKTIEALKDEAFRSKNGQ